MGRGIWWTDVELENLVRGWAYAFKDGITGVDKTATRFREAMFAKYKSFAPQGWSDQSYGGRSPKSAHSKFDEVAADIPKFSETLRSTRAANPMGVTEDELIYMTIAKTSVSAMTCPTTHVITYTRSGKMIWHTRCSVHIRSFQMKGLHPLKQWHRFNNKTCSLQLML